MIRQHLKFLGASCAVALCLAATAHAGTIIGVNEVTGGGTAVIDPIVTLDPNNDNVSSPLAGNLAVISKIFTVDEPIDIVFDVNTSQGTSEYYIAEGVANVSGSEFIGYSFQLGFGTGDNFVMSGNDGLDFDTPSLDPGPTSGRFITLSHQDDWLRWTEGVGGIIT